MVDIKNIPARLKSDCRFCVWKFEKRSGQKTKMPYNPANGDRARINDLRTFADFKTTLMTYAMGGYDGIGIAVGNGIGAFDIDHCIREDGTLNDTAATVLSIFPTAYVEKSPSGKGLRGFFGVPEDFVYDKTVYYINNRSKGLEVYMPGATNRFVTVTGDVYRTGEIPNDETAMTTLLDSLMKRNKQVQNTQLRHHSYLDDDAVISHAEEASNGDKFKKLYAGDWEELYDSQSDADMALLSILAFWCGCDEEQMDRIFRTSGLMRDKWDRRQAGTTYGAISIRNTVNTCAAVYVPVNAQDIVDEEFTNLDPESKSPEFQPDITKLTLSLDEMAPHTNPRYGRDEIGMGNMSNETWMNAKKAVELGFADEILFSKKEDEPDSDPANPDKPEKTPDEEPGEGEEKKPFQQDTAGHLFSSRQMDLIVLNRLGVKPDTPAAQTEPPSDLPAEAGPVLDMDGKTEEGDYSYNVLMKQLECMK